MPLALPRFLLCMSLALPLLAQSEAGGAALNGTVTDPSGASMAAVQVTARNLETGFEGTTRTSEAGLYNLVRLPVGRYEVTFTMEGFKPARHGEIRLGVGAATML